MLLHKNYRTAYALTIGAIRSTAVEWSLLGTLVIGTMASAQAASAASGDVFNLGILAAGADSGAIGINSAGQVTGNSFLCCGIGPRAFRYSGTPGNGGAMTQLLDFDSNGTDINDAGQVVGFFSMGTQIDRPFLYTGTPGVDGHFYDLGQLDGGGPSLATAINNAGQIVGSSHQAFTGANRAFLYTGTPGVNGQMTDLGTLGGAESGASGINNSGQITGFGETVGGQRHAYLYTGTPGIDGQMHDLGALGGIESYGIAVNDAGQVTGEFYTGTGESHVFLHTGAPGAGGSMSDLGTLGGKVAFAEAINIKGAVAGQSTTADGAQRAFLYVGTPGVDGHMINLDKWLDSVNPIEGGKWTLSWAEGLNDNGLVVGYGDYNDGPGGLEDGRRAFLLDASALVVPEPCYLSLIAVFAVALSCSTRFLGYKR